MCNELPSKYLLKTLQGVLMILPICKSFHCLKARLECVKIAKNPMPLTITSTQKNFFGEEYIENDDFKIENCLAMFDEGIVKV